MARRQSTSDGYRGVEFPSFGGLDFRKDPQDGAAVDLLNVDFDLDGRVRSRDGTANLWVGASSTSTDGHPIFELRLTGFSYLVFTSASGGTYAVNQATGVTVNNSGAGESLSSPIRDGVTIGSTLYVALGQSNSLSKYGGGAGSFSTVTSSPLATYLTIQRPDNRLVTVGNGSTHVNRVQFSNANDPETFGTDDWVDLTLAGGEVPIGAAFWNNMTFVFASNTIFVFTGNSVDNVGGAVFNYRTVYHGLATPPLRTAAYADRVAAGIEGVYFLARDGVYLTTGGQPVKVSEQLDPLFDESAFSDDYFSGTALDLTKMRLYYAARRLFLVADAEVYVFTPLQRAWSLWDFGVTVGAIVGASPPGTTGGRQEIFFTYTANSKANIAKSSSSLATDLGSGMTSAYQTGFMDLGDGGAEKKVREWILHGSGAPTARTAINDQSAFEAIAATPLGPFGTGPVYEYRFRRASRARNISLRVGATSGAWSLSRIIANVAGQRPESLRG